MLEGEPTFGSVQFATPDFFRVFGAAPAAGRFWTAQENRASVALNPEVPVRFSTMDDAFSKALAYPRFRAVLVAGFAVLAVALALIGIYGVLSYLVAARTPEIGVRMALGALRRDIFSDVMSGSMRLVTGGLLVGLLLTLAVVRVLQTVLYGVSPRDPLTIASVAGLFVLTAFLASSVPALRASRVDPLVALRQDSKVKAQRQDESGCFARGVLRPSTLHTFR